MKKKKRKKSLKIIVSILLILIIIILATSYLKEERKKKIFNNIQPETFFVDKYYIYGTHFNVEGKISGINVTNIKQINFVLVCENEFELEYGGIYNIKDGYLSFSTSNLINEGVNLEEINEGKYYALLKIVYDNNEEKYFSMKNNTEYKNLEYYTITRKNSNKKLNIDFGNYNNIPYLAISANIVKLPEGVYDISIDPGHGGSDPGAVNGKYQEAEIAMKYSVELKKALEELGLKVILTRDGTEDKSENSNFNVYSVYNHDGRVNVVGKSKAKYNLSIHLNSLEVNTINGTEIYAPSNASLELAQKFADNIVNIAKTTYSTRTIDKVSDGVYVRTFTEEEISKSSKDDKNSGYMPYNRTTSTSYMYMIREVGGIATGAYVDGRNQRYGTNEYYNSNIGIESYLIELGYINNKKDLNNMLNNQSAYITAIKKTVEEYICKK